MIRNLAILTALIALALAYTAYSDHARPLPRPVETITPDTPVAGRRAPDFAFEALDGTKGRMADHKGKVIVLNFWASWCTPCVAEFPQLLELAAAFPDKMVLLAISADHDPQAMQRFIATLEKNHGTQLNAKNVIITRDSDKSVTRDIFQTVRLPETILIDADFVMREKIAGITEWTGPDMHRKIEKFYSEK